MVFIYLLLLLTTNSEQPLFFFTYDTYVSYHPSIPFRERSHSYIKPHHPTGRSLRQFRRSFRQLMLGNDNDYISSEENTNEEL